MLKHGLHCSNKNKNNGASLDHPPGLTQDPADSTACGVRVWGWERRGMHTADALFGRRGLHFGVEGGAARLMVSVSDPTLLETQALL